MHAILKRVYQPKQTVGHITLFDGFEKKFEGKVLELPWLDNDNNVSCIPEGTYYVRPFKSTKFGNCFEVVDVPGRSAILFHAGTYVTHTEGCLLVGFSLADLNKDGLLDVANSKDAINELVSKASKFRLTIIS
jgi:hypothetical protein